MNGLSPIIAGPQISDPLPLAALRPTAAAPVTAADEIRVRIVNGAMEMRALRVESMSVIIRPDPRTEMVLNLSMLNGLIDVEARLQRGEAGALAAQWSQLQQSLSQQGIRLHARQAPETGSNQFADPFDSPPSGPEQAAPREQENSNWTPPRPGRPAIRNASSATPAPHSADGTFESWA